MKVLCPKTALKLIGREGMQHHVKSYSKVNIIRCLASSYCITVFCYRALQASYLEMIKQLIRDKLPYLMQCRADYGMC